MRTVTTTIMIFSALLAEIILSPTKLEIRNPNITAEEFPLVPIVFFDSSSFKVDARFDEALREIAGRMKDNPDAIIEIRGYYHIAGDGALGSPNLAKRRAESIREKLISFAPEIAQRVIVEPSPDPTKLRRGNYASQDIRIQQENQRAEIEVKPSFELDLETGKSAKITVSEMNSKGSLYRIKRLLLDNPMMFLLVDGNDPQKLMELQNELRKELGEQVAMRIFANVYGSEKMRISLHCDWVIRGPMRFSRVKGTCNPNIINVSSNIGESIDIFSANGGKICSVSNIWTLNDIPDPMNRYFGTFLSQTKTRQYERQWSNSVSFVCKGDVKISERIVLCNYNLDQTDAPKDFCASANRSKLVDRLISICSNHENKQTKLRIVGYTDDTGDDEKNRQMSQLWAELEAKEIQKLLEYYGIGDKFEIVSLGERNGDINSLISGKNFDETKPEGRTAKRRVEIQIEY